MKEYNVFISYKTQYQGIKTRDSQIAQEIYQQLKSIAGVQPFLDTEELYKADGSSDFSATIFEALSTAKFFIYICTNPDFLRTPYIEGEWTTYLGELNSGRKPKGSIFGIIEDVNTEDIPLGLRKFEMLTFSPHNVEMLKKFVETRLRSFQGHSNITPDEWKDLRISEIKAEAFLYRNNNVSLFLDEFLAQEDCRLAFLWVDRKYHSSSLLRAEVLSLCTEYDVYFFDTVAQMKGILKNTRIVSEEKQPLIIVNQVYSSEEYTRIEDLIAFHSNCRFICAAYEGVVRDRFGYAFSTQIHAPTNFELDMLVNTICQDIGYPHSNTLLDKFMLPMYESFRTPELISIVIRQLKDTQTVTDSTYSALLFYEILDDYLDSLDPQVTELIYNAVEICTEKGINRFLKKEVGGTDAAISVLVNHGILDSVRNSYLFSCEDYLSYKMADNIIATYGAKSIEYLLGHDLEMCIPFCISIMIQKYRYKPAFHFLQKIQQEHVEKLIEFLITSSSLSKIITVPNCFSAYLKILYRYIDHGYCHVAQNSINRLCENAPEYAKHMEIRQLRMIIHYYLNGIFDDCGNTESMVYWMYKGLICYYADEYEEAEKSFEQALQLSDSNKSTCYILMNYADVLVDCGKICKLNTLLDKYFYIFSDLQDYENYYIYRGNVALAQMNLADAYEYYSESYSKIISYYKANTVARICGNLGLVEYYRGHSKRAEQFFLKNHNICLDSSNANGIAISRQYLCLLRLMEGRIDEAYAYIAAAIYYAAMAHNNWRIHQARFLIDHFSDGFEDQLPTHIAAIESIPSPQYHSDSYILLLECMLRSCCGKQLIMEVIERAEVANKKVDCSLNSEIIHIYKDLLTNQVYRSNWELSIYAEYAEKLVCNYMEGKKISVMNKPLPFSKYHEMETERLALKHISRQYAAGIFGFSSRQQPTKYVLWERHKTIMDTYSYIDFLQKLEITGEYMIWILIEKKSNSVIGTIDLNYEPDYNGVEFGIILSDFYWHRGYAGEALCRILEFARTELSLNEIIGVCVNGNRSSEKLMMRNGFIFEKTIEDYHNINGLMDKSGKVFKKKL